MDDPLVMSNHKDERDTQEFINPLHVSKRGSSPASPSELSEALQMVDRIELTDAERELIRRSRFEEDEKVSWKHAVKLFAEFVRIRRAGEVSQTQSADASRALLELPNRVTLLTQRIDTIEGAKKWRGALIITLCGAFLTFVLWFYDRTSTASERSGTQTEQLRVLEREVRDLQQEIRDLRRGKDN